MSGSARTEKMPDRARTERSLSPNTAIQPWRSQ